MSGAGTSAALAVLGDGAPCHRHLVGFAAGEAHEPSTWLGWPSLRLTQAPPFDACRARSAVEAARGLKSGMPRCVRRKHHQGRSGSGLRRGWQLDASLVRERGATSRGVRLSPAHADRQAFRHDALLYDGDEEFLAGAAAVHPRGLEAGEPVLVAVDTAQDRPAALRAGRATREHVHFADMREIGGNPARIIPAWRQFVDARSSRRAARPGHRRADLGGPQRGRARGVPAARVAAQPRLRRRAPLSLLCPYDTGALDAERDRGGAPQPSDDRRGR